MYLVMLETNGNQAYIFSSPRLRESIGASYQLTQLTQWTEEALGSEEVRHPDGQADLPWVSRSSGKVIVIVDDESSAQGVIGRVTRRALSEAPGMDVSGVYVDMGGKDHVDEDLLKAVHTRAAEYALRRPPAAARFAQMPFLARAADSVLPAGPPLGLRDEAAKDKQAALSLPARIARHRALPAKETLLDRARLECALPDQWLARDLLTLEKMLQAPDDDDSLALSKVAVIHIDGNGVGAIMRDLHAAMNRVPQTDFTNEIGCERQDPDALRRFILAVNNHLEDAVARSFTAAWGKVAALHGQDDPRIAAIPVVPVILGGDDVTVITSGTYALPFAATYLGTYEKETADNQILRFLARPEDQKGPMTAAAGVAVVRHHFPFHIAYQLAERLVTAAKRVGKARKPAQSSLSYHVLFDSTVLDADQILTAYQPLTCRPFLLDSYEHEGTETPLTWHEVCGKVLWFQGQMAEDPLTGSAPFPKTRAARIRKLLSDAARARLTGGAGRAEQLERSAEREWLEAEETGAISTTAADRIGGIEALFDLMELTDLLPDSYLREVAPPIGAGENTSASTREARS